MDLNAEWICDQDGRLINLDYVTDIQIDGTMVVAHMQDNRLIFIAKCKSTLECQKVIDKIINHLGNVIDI